MQKANDSELVKEAFKEIFPEKRLAKNAKIIYSNKFKPYGANIRMDHQTIVLHMSNHWTRIDKEIQKGLIQELLLKIYKNKKSVETISTKLYTNFVKNLHTTVPVTETNPFLEESFKRMNKKYFLEQVSQPNISWSRISRTKMGSYNYKTDTIKINPLLKAEEELLDYVMFHEMLHKFHSYEVKKGKTYYHTSRFRKLEKQFENAEEMERRLKRL